MGNNNYFDELIVSYLSNELNAEDEAFVLDWVSSSEQNKQYFEELKSAWLLLAAEELTRNIDVENEWLKFKAAKGSGQIEIPGADTKSFYADVQEELKPAVKGKPFNLFAPISVAAATLIVVAIATWHFFDNKAGTTKQTPIASNPINASSGHTIKHEYNLTNEVKHLTLQDGSKVELYGESEISYPQPFIENRRLITLVGKAHFKVAKDKTKPFTVVSGDISTTALGTQFTVSAFSDKKNIIVRLYEGKVLVQSSHQAVKKWMKKYFLLPGDELTYDYTKLVAKVRSFRAIDNLARKLTNKKEATANDNPSIPTTGGGTWYMFNNQSLAQVFDQLGGMFNVRIQYNKKDVFNNYFIGSFNTADSLDTILKEIATLNNLKITRKNNKIIISK